MLTCGSSGCEVPMRQCEQHCQCPNCKGSCANKPIIQPGQVKWCRRCREYRCQQVPKRLVDGRKPCLQTHEGCMEANGPLQQTIMPVVRRDVIKRYTAHNTQRSVAATTASEVQRLLRRLRPEKPPSPEEIMLASFRAGRPNYPLSMVIAGLTNEGIVVSAQASVWRGSGRLRLPVHCDRHGLDALRTVYSFVVLHQKALEAHFGLPMQHDLSTRERDVRIDLPSIQGSMKGSSLGGVAALSLLQALTDCAFHNDVAVTGELSLTGELWSVEDLSAKVQGAGEAGLKRAVLPPLHLNQEPLPNPLDGVEVIHVSSLFEAISKMVIGCGRKAMSDSYEWPRDLVVVRTLLEAVESQHWVRQVEIAAVPGHGEIHITGEISTGVRNSVHVALQTVFDNWERIMLCLTKDVARRIDLELMCREGDQERNTLDLHVNFTEYYQAVEDCNSTLAIVLGLIALSLGLRYPSDVSVAGHCTVGGLMMQVASPRSSLLVAGPKLGIHKVVACSEEVLKMRRDNQVAVADDAMQLQEEEEKDRRAEVSIRIGMGRVHEERFQLIGPMLRFNVTQAVVADYLFQALGHVFPQYRRP